MSSAFAAARISASAAAEQVWDVVIIGAGMGGCAISYALARAETPLRILVLEKGQASFTASAGVAKDIEDPAARRAVGRWPGRLRSRIDGQSHDIFVPLGCGVGGSSLLYAAALDRMRPVDFDDQELPDGRRVSWPITYDEIAPFYAEAEARLEVCGTPDPLAPDMKYDLPAPPEASPCDAWFMDAFEQAGLHPYRLHVGQRHVPGCKACLGEICLRDCKRNGGNAFLLPALETGRVQLCTEANVTRIEAEGARVTGAVLDTEEGPRTVQARAVVLAAGAYFSPVLLQNSASADWPHGLANHHDQVGRNLMFHADRQLAVWARRGLSREGPKKSIALRDFYELPGGEKCGELQSTGAQAQYGNVLYVLRKRFDASRWARVPLLRHLLRIPAFVADRLLGSASIFALIIEDFPYPQNRVVADASAPSGMRFEYDIPGELYARSARLTAAVSRAMTGLRRLWLTQKPELNLGHPCGTCRTGESPESSVVDARCRAHGTENLYLACASVFATSGATNPSLTVAAMALRTGAHLADELAPAP